MTENIVIFLLSFGFLNRKLQLALYFTHKQVVNHYVVGGIFELVLNPNQFKLSIHGFALIQQVHRFEQRDKAGFTALEFSSHQIADFEHNKIEIADLLVSFWMTYVLSSL